MIEKESEQRGRTKTLGNEVRHFKDLMVCQRSHQLFLDVVRDIESFKKDVALKIIMDQIIRSIGSISSNIAEGFNSRTRKQYLSFLDIARRSAVESENWFYKLRDIGQLERDKAETRINECVEINKVGMHFTQPATRCRIGSWKSQGIPSRASIILEQSRTLINGLAAKMLALNILENFDGLKALFAPAVEKKLTSLP